MRGWRKFGIAGTALVMSFVALLIGKITGDNWVWVVSAILALYGTANAAVHMAQKKKDGEARTISIDRGKDP